MSEVLDERGMKPAPPHDDVKDEVRRTVRNDDLDLAVYEYGAPRP